MTVSVKLGVAIALVAAIPAACATGPPPPSAGPRANLSGFWRVVDHIPGDGLFSGRMTVRRRGDGLYEVTTQLIGADDTVRQRSGRVTVGAGGAWRGALTAEGLEITETATVSGDGNTVAGRWFPVAAPDRGGAFRAVRMAEGIAAVMAVSPSSLRAGETAEVTLHGTGMAGPVDLGAGVRVIETIVDYPVTIVVQVRVAGDANPGPRIVAVGASARAPGLFSIQR